MTLTPYAVVGLNKNTPSYQCRSWLASEGGLETCIANKVAFAGKPAPTGIVSGANYSFIPGPCGSWLVGPPHRSEGDLQTCIAHADAFAGKWGVSDAELPDQAAQALPQLRQTA